MESNNEAKGKYLSSNDQDFHLKVKRMDLDAGLLGKVFGTGSNAAINIAGTVVILLIAIGVIIIYWPPNSITVEKYWGYIFSVITLILGYLFGKKDP